MVDQRSENSNRLVLWGAIAGLGACLIYPSVVFSPLPDRAKVVLAAMMGPPLGVVVRPEGASAAPRP